MKTYLQRSWTGGVSPRMLMERKASRLCLQRGDALHSKKAAARWRLGFGGAAILILVLAAGCSKGGDTAAQKPAAAPTATDAAMKDLKLPAGLEPAGKESSAKDYEGKFPEGSGSSYDSEHPDLDAGEKVQREAQVPDEIKGKWKAVKVMVRNKKDESLNEMKVVDLGSSFNLGDSGIKVTVGPFLPNFVMTQTQYTSADNQLNNPAVQLVVEEKGKVVYKGWAFAKYPTMYAYEHEVFGLQLMDFIPAPVS